MHAPNLPGRDELLQLYRIAVEEYRFEVQLGWSRAEHFLVLSGGTLAAGAGLLRIATADVELNVGGILPVVLVFVFGAATSFLGIGAVRRSHRYYRATIAKKTFIESLLGYTESTDGSNDPVRTLAITTTEGMQEIQNILGGGSEWVRRPSRKRTVGRTIQVILGLFGGLHVLCAILAGWPLVALIESFWRRTLESAPVWLKLL